MIKSMRFIETPYKVNFINVVFGMMFKEDYVSTKTQDRIVSKHFIEICRALLYALPSIGSSLLLKPRQLPASILATIQQMDPLLYPLSRGQCLRLSSGILDVPLRLVVRIISRSFRECGLIDPPLDNHFFFIILGNSSTSL